MMASSSSILPECSCKLCMEPFLSPVTVPKSMPNCPHTFCLKCLLQIEKKEAEITCPECNTQNMLGSTGVEGFQTNLALQKIVDRLLSLNLIQQGGTSASQQGGEAGWSVQPGATGSREAPPPYMTREDFAKKEDLPPPKIGTGCRISPSASIAPGVVIESGCSIEENVVIKSGAIIRAGAAIRSGAVIGNNVKIKSGAIVESGAILNDGCVLECGARIGPNVTLPPNYRVACGTFFG